MAFRTTRSLALLFSLAVVPYGAAQNWVLGWQNTLSEPNADVVGFFTTYDALGNVLLVTRTRVAKRTDVIQIRKASQYGKFYQTLTIATANTGTPKGFAVDPKGDMFLLYDQLDKSYNASTILDGFEANGTPLFTETLNAPEGQSYSSLGLGTDTNGYVYAAILSQGSGDQVQYMKFSRTGGSILPTPTANLYSSYAQFDRNGRCAVIGYDYLNGNLLGCHAVLFNNSNGIAIQKQITNSSSNHFYFGGANFDPAGNFYLNTITETVSSGNATSVADCYSTAFAKTFETSGISGFAWYGAANGPTKANVWGSSDVGNTTGQFIADVSKESSTGKRPPMANRSAECGSTSCSEWK